MNRRTHPNPRPSWRVSNAGPAQAGDVLSLLNDQSPEIPSEPGFSTHFQTTRGPLARATRALGCYTKETSKVTVSHRVITLTRERHSHLFGMPDTTTLITGVLFMHHIMEALNHAPDVTLVFANDEHTLRNLCRPTAFTQAVNRMLASPEQPPDERCGTCQHYRRWNWSDGGNEGHCVATTPEAHSDCPQQGNDHWCPAYLRIPGDGT